MGGGKTLPAGCSLVDVEGIEYADVGGHLTPQGGPVSSRDNGYNGFTITRLGGLPAGSLAVHCHSWHNGVSAIHLRVVYVISEPDGTDCTASGIVLANP